MRKKIFFTFLLAAVFYPFSGLMAYVPSDPMYGQQQYLQQINMEKAWDTAKGDEVVVAILDSGVDIDHPDLKLNVWKNAAEIAGDGLDNDHNGFVDDIAGWDFVAASPDPRPKLDDGYNEMGVNHGTAIAGLVAAVANNNRGITGVAFRSKIMAVRILAGDGTGDVENLIKGINYAVDNGADVINLSLVGYDYSEGLAAAIKSAYENNVSIVAAAGNTSAAVNGINLDLTPAYPACYGDNAKNNWVVGVSAVDASDVKSFFSNYGTSCIDLTAPGEDFLSLAYYDPAHGFDDYYADNWSGTSFSTALVSGVAALVKSSSQSARPGQIVSALTESADSIDGKNFQYFGQLGAGRLNAASAVDSKIKPAGGYLAKLPDSTSIYYVGADGRRHLFPNEQVYWSWYDGHWADQNIEILTQKEFEALAAGPNVVIRPGTRLIKFANSPRIYAVSPGGVIHYLTDETARHLYGGSYRSRVALIQNAFEVDYQRGEPAVNGAYPDGTILQDSGADKIWYMNDSEKRLVTDAGFLANNFKKADLLVDTVSVGAYNIGKDINHWEAEIFPYVLDQTDGH